MIATQGIQGIAFFEATACLTLLVLFVHLKRDNPGVFYKFWLFGWVSLTVASFSELAYFFGYPALLRILATGSGIAALVLFLASIVQLTLGQNRFFWPMIWLSVLMAVTAGYYQTKAGPWGQARWESSILESMICLASGWLLWRAADSIRGHGTKLLAGAFDEPVVPLLRRQILTQTGQVKHGDPRTVFAQAGRNSYHERRLTHLACREHVADFSALQRLVKRLVSRTFDVRRRVPAKGSAHNEETGR